MILKNLQVDAGNPVVSGDVIIGIYIAGINDPMICILSKLSTYYRNIQKVLYSIAVGKSRTMKRSSIEDCVRPLP